VELVPLARKDGGPVRGAACLVMSLVLIPSLVKALPGSGDLSPLTLDESLEGVPEECPGWILENQVLVEVVHWGFDGSLHAGQVVADARVAGDLRCVFLLMLLLRFPLESVAPVSQFGWDDFESMRGNNTSAFNYRAVPGTDRLSRHAYGLAIDINPLQNPYYTGVQVFPERAVHDPSVPGTLCDGHPVVELFRALGWRWGGDWQELDYQHFDKPLETTAPEDA
jgi:peptidoglycan LD-endopeptidase CwlK